MAGDCERIELDDECWLDLHRGWVEDDAALLAELAETAPWEHEEITLFGRRVHQPRLTAWFGVGMDASTRYRTTRPAAPFPPSVERVRQSIVDHVGVPFNSALANLYRDGNDSVAWHADDEPALGEAPVIASVSFGCPRTFRLRRRDKTKSLSLPLGNGDLVVMHGQTQRDWVHAVPKSRAKATSPRINLTFRRYFIGPD